jgi:hypothetical protein
MQKLTGHMHNVEFSLKVIPSVFRVDVNVSFRFKASPILLFSSFFIKKTINKISQEAVGA